VRPIRFTPTDTSPDFPTPAAAHVVVPGAVAVVAHPGKVGHDGRERLVRMVAAGGAPAPRWYETTAADPGPGQARRALADGAGMVVAWGGDGTVLGVIEGMAGTQVPLGILPGGTGNLLARNLGVPLELDAAIATAYSGANRTIDLLDVDLGGGEHRLSAVMCGTGWDAAMMAAPESLKRRFGWGAYAAVGAVEIRQRPMQIRISVDDAPPVSLTGRTVLVANVGMLVAGLDLIPEAVPDDGLLDVMVIDPSTPFDWVRTTTGVVRGAESASDPSRTHLRGRRVRVHTGHVRRRQVDGDLVSNGSGLDVQVLPGALTVRVPR
jgi:diacylglycerol kinase (ATP)